MRTREFRIRNRLTELDPLADGLREVCLAAGMDEEGIADVRLLAEEAVSNTIRHGYADGADHEILVRTTVDGGAVQVEIEDDARAFNPLEAPLPDVELPVEEKNPGGLGILLLRSLADRLEYRRSGRKNVLTFARAIRRA